MKATLFYIILTIMAFTLIGVGIFLIDKGGALSVVGGLLCALIGFIIGLILYGDKWSWWQ